MKRMTKRAAVLLAVAMLALQTAAFAAPAPESVVLPSPAMAETVSIQPRGAFFWQGTSTISPNSGSVTVSGQTKCYEAVGEVGVTLTVYRSLGGGAWEYVWSNTYKGYNTRTLQTPNINVPTGSGTYKVEGYHYAIKNGVTESNWSETNSVTVW